MVKVLFVCLGNICRSPMAEFVFKDLVKKAGIEKEFYVESAAISDEEIGNKMHYGTVEKLIEHGIEFGDKRARRLKVEDYEKFDYIIGMEDRHIKDIERMLGEDYKNKVSKLLDYTNNSHDIADPWYTGNFTITYKEVLEGCFGFLEFLYKKG